MFISLPYTGHFPLFSAMVYILHFPTIYLENKFYILLLTLFSTERERFSQGYLPTIEKQNHDQHFNNKHANNNAQFFIYNFVPHKEINDDEKETEKVSTNRKPYFNCISTGLKISTYDTQCKITPQHLRSTNLVHNTICEGSQIYRVASQIWKKFPSASQYSSKHNLKVRICLNGVWYS